MKLYGIIEADVIDTINLMPPSAHHKHNVEIVNENLSEKYRYPLKVVFSLESDTLTVVTTYPLKREKSK